MESPLVLRGESGPATASVNAATVRWLGLTFLALVFSLHAAFKGLHADLDALAYAEWFQLISRFDVASFWGALQESDFYFQGDLFFSFETGFAILTFLLTQLFSSIEALFFSIAFLSLMLKFWALQKMRLPLFWVLAWYFSWYYLLLDMTSIRAGLAASVVLVGVAFLRDGGPLRACLCFLLATTFHVSAALAFVVLLVHWKPLGPRGLLVLALTGVALSFLSLLPLIEVAGFFVPKLAEYYQIYTDIGFYTELNRFNVILLLRLFFLFVVVLLVARGHGHDRDFRFAATLFLVPIFCFHAFASFPLVAGRIYEFLGVLQLLFIGWVATRLRRDAIVNLLLAVIVVAQFSILVYHVRFVDFFYFYGQPYKIDTDHRN